MHLSVSLGHLESARVLLRYGANANAENKGYWSGRFSENFPVLRILLKSRYRKLTKGLELNDQFFFNGGKIQFIIMLKLAIV